MKKINFFISSIIILSMFSNVGIVLAQMDPNSPDFGKGATNVTPKKTVLEKIESGSCTGLDSFIRNSARLGSIKGGAQMTISAEAHKQINKLSNDLSKKITSKSESLIKKGTKAIGDLFKSREAKNLIREDKNRADRHKLLANGGGDTISPEKPDLSVAAPDASKVSKTAKVDSNSLTGKEQRVDQANANTAVATNDKAGAKAIEGNTAAVEEANASITTATVAADETKKQQDCNDLFAYYTNKGVLADMIKTTTSWISTGNAGTPFYVLDQASYYKSIFKQTLDKQINSNTTNDYLGKQVNNMLISQMTGKTPNSNASKSADPAAIATNNFNKDFKSGGWDSWMNTSMGDNPISRYLTTVNQLSRESSEKQQIARDELNQGSGFLSQKTCVQYSKQKNANGNFICEHYSTDIPGSIIKAQAEMATTTQMRQLELADKMDQTLGGIFDDMFNKLISGGFTSMKGSTNTSTQAGTFNSSGGFGVNAVLDSQGNAITRNGRGGTNNGLPEPYEYSLGNGQGVNIDTIVNTEILAQILKDQYAVTNRLKDNVVISKKLVENTGKLDHFLPGPNVPSVQYAVDNLDKINNSLPQYANQYFMTGDEVRSYFNSKRIAVPSWEAWAIPVANNPNAHYISDNGESNIDNSIDQVETISPYLTYKLGDPITNSYIKYNPWYTLSIFNISNQNKSDTRSNGKGDNAAIGSSVGSAAGAAIGSIIPGVGTVIGGAVGNLLGGLLGGLIGSNDEHSWYQRDPIDKDTLSNSIGSWLDDYWARTSDRFSVDNLIDVYLNIDKKNTAADIRGYVKDARTESDNLLIYNSQAIGIDTAYKNNINVMQQNTAELEKIYNRTQKIVSAAKARHIAEMKAQGITINSQCLDSVYYTGSNPVPTDTDISRKESDNDQDLVDMNNYQKSFYEKLCSTQSLTAKNLIVDTNKIKFICEVPNKFASALTSALKPEVCFVSKTDMLNDQGVSNKDTINIQLVLKSTRNPINADTNIAINGLLNGRSFNTVFYKGNTDQSTKLTYQTPINPTTYNDSNQQGRLPERTPSTSIMTIYSVVPSPSSSMYDYKTSCN